MTTQARVDKGVPSGGEFKATAHSDAVPPLAPQAAALTHDPELHRRLHDMVDDRYSAIARMLKEHDQLSMAALASGIRRDFPDATELRVKLRFDERGSRMSPRMVSVRDGRGNDLTAGIDDWTTRADPDNQTHSGTFQGIRVDYIEYHNNDVFGWDDESGEVIIPLDYDYAAGILG
jgi:hypothetical protein